MKLNPNNPSNPVVWSVPIGTFDRDGGSLSTPALYKGVGKADATTMKSFEAIWTADRAVTDAVAATLALGDADAAKLLESAKDAETTARCDWGICVSRPESGRGAGDVV